MHAVRGGQLRRRPRLDQLPQLLGWQLLSGRFDYASTLPWRNIFKHEWTGYFVGLPASAARVLGPSGHCLTTSMPNERFYLSRFSQRQGEQPAWLTASSARSWGYVLSD